jgi:hypothetical protein
MVSAYSEDMTDGCPAWGASDSACSCSASHFASFVTMLPPMIRVSDRGIVTGPPMRFMPLRLDPTHTEVGGRVGLPHTHDGNLQRLASEHQAADSFWLSS